MWKSSIIAVLCGIVLLSYPLDSMAQHRKAIDRSTDVIAFVPALTGLALVWSNRDMQGLKQIALSGGTALATNYLLELAIKKDRPDGSGEHAFPSTHAAIAFTGAAFVQRRYGWKWGIPAYLASGYVAWGRIYAKKHDVWDVLAGTAIGAGAGYLFTRPFLKTKSLTLTPAVIGGKAGVNLSAQF